MREVDAHNVRRKEVIPNGAIKEWQIHFHPLELPGPEVCPPDNQPLRGDILVGYLSVAPVDDLLAHEREPVEALMRSCEEAINGAPINERQSIDLVRRLRKLEGSLGLRMRSREARQAAEKI